MPHEALFVGNNTNSSFVSSEINPMYASIPPSASSIGSSVNALVIVLVIIAVTVVITCAIGHSRMGPSLWTDLRNSLTPPPSQTPQPSPQSSHSLYEDHPSSPTYSVDREHLWNPQTRTFPQKNSNKQSKFQVLYVCERVNNSPGSVMAAARERSSTRYPTVHPSQQHDTRLGYPIQVAMPDGETRRHHYNPSLRHNCSPEQETELTRGYIKPPENRSLSDLEGISANRAFSAGTLTARDTSGRCHRNAAQPHRHSAPLEGSPSAVDRRYQCSPSSSSGWSDEGRGHSPKRGRKVFQKQFLPTFLKSDKSSQDRRGGPRTSPLLPYPTTTTTLADIAVVPCGTADCLTAAIPGYSHLQPNYSTPLEEPSAEDDPPPIYSDVVENPCMYRSVQPSCRDRTHSDHI